MKKAENYKVPVESCLSREGTDTNSIFYRLGKLAFVIGLIALILYYLGWFEALEPYNYCIFKRTVGLYCPGCGGTRALKALLAGRPLLSLYAHPAVLYYAVLYVVFMIRMLCSLHFSEGAGFPGFLSRPVSEKRVVHLIIGGIVLIFVQWIVKNTVLVAFHYRWLV